MVVSYPTKLWLLFLLLDEGADPSGREWDAACRSEVEDYFRAAPVGADMSDTRDERKSPSERNGLIQRVNATCGKTTQDVAVYEGQRKCSACRLSCFSPVVQQFEGTKHGPVWRL
jgi:hypothetical protein